MSDAATKDSFVRRREAGVFLRLRRGRLAPSDVGLPQGLRRRTPGLRREEVALLAGVGVTWYTWLEQGREIQPSNEVLLALSRVLRLDPAERDYLFSLYDSPTQALCLPAEQQVTEPLRQMLDGLAVQPAFVLGWRWDILAWNRPAELVVGLHLGFGADRPNVLELVFSDLGRALFVDWEKVARGMLATFRADCARHIGDADFKVLVARLTRTSPEFASWWPQHAVAHRLAGVKRLDHPSVGRMDFAFSMLAVGDRPGMKLCVFTPVDEEDTPAKMRRLLKRPPLAV